MNYSLKIYGADCAACKVHIASTLKKVEGISNISVNISSNIANFKADITPNFKEIEKVLKRSGYSLPYDKAITQNNIDIKDKNEVINNIYFVKDIEDENGQTIIYLYPINVTKNTIISEFEKYGIKINILRIESGVEDTISNKEISLLKKLLLSVFLTIPIFVNVSPIVQFILGTLILVIAFSYFKYGLKKCLHKVINMDLLISLSTFLVYLYSTYLAFTQKENVKLYYLCEGVLVSLVLFGRYLEIIAQGESEKSIKNFINLLPHEARVVSANTERKVDIDLVKEDEIILVNEGERVPLDSIIESGSGFFDESVITGESTLKEKKIKDDIIAGTYLKEGKVYAKVIRKSENSIIEQMIGTVRNATLNTSPIKKLSDKIVQFFIPTVLIISIFIFSLYYFCLDKYNLEKSLLNSISVLVISCPCALGLAIPTSIMVGTGKASFLGILFKNANAIEKMSKIKIIAFDKTGTITYGGDKTERNELRPNVRNTIDRLSKKYKIVLISGDSANIANEVGKMAGIKNIYSNVLPSEKANIIKNLKKEGMVMMIGDGINDAPSISLADVGVSIQNGTDIARDSADIILLNDDIAKIEDAFYISKKIMNNIHINLLWATLYNLICIPLAGCGIINPSIASAAMSFSSCAVLLNSLRLNKLKALNGK